MLNVLTRLLKTSIARFEIVATSGIASTVASITDIAKESLSDTFTRAPL
jgi:hypothetical protein